MVENIFPAVFVFKAFVSCAVTNTAGSLGCGEPINTQHYLIHSDYGRVHAGLRVCTRAHPANLLHCLLFFFSPPLFAVHPRDSPLRFLFPTMHQCLYQGEQRAAQRVHFTLQTFSIFQPPLCFPELVVIKTNTFFVVCSCKCTLNQLHPN